MFVETFALPQRPDRERFVQLLSNPQHKFAREIPPGRRLRKGCAVLLKDGDPLLHGLTKLEKQYRKCQQGIMGYVFGYVFNERDERNRKTLPAS